MTLTFLQNLGPATVDLLVLGGLFLLFFAYAMYFGKDRIISLILAFYPAQLLYKIFPFLDKLLVLKGGLWLVVNRIFIFLLFLIPINIIIARYVFSDSGYGSQKIFRVAGFSLVGVILVLIFNYSVINFGPIYNFSESIGSLFSPDKIFYWDLASLGILFFL